MIVINQPPHYMALRDYLLLRCRPQLGKAAAARRCKELGKASRARPAGILIWIYAVALGEFLALRPLAERMQRLRLGQSPLLTSEARFFAHAIDRLAEDRLSMMEPTA